MTTTDSLAAALRQHSRHVDGGIVEQAHMVGSPGAQMFTVTTRPDDPAETRSTGVVVCHSFFELKMFQGAELTLLREAARRGFAGAYIQAPGMGDSEGDPFECTVERRVATAMEAADFLGREVPGVERICFFGARFGGAIALLTAARHPQGGPVVLWDPALDGEEYWKHTRRFARVVAALGRKQVDDPDAQFERDDTAIAIGYQLTAQMRADLASIDQVRSQQPVGGPGLLVGLNDALVFSARSALRPLVPGLDTISMGLPKPRHLIHMRIGDARGATRATLDWMQRRLG